jgi:hypothetical protein
LLEGYAYRLEQFPWPSGLKQIAANAGAPEAQSARGTELGIKRRRLSAASKENGRTRGNDSRKLAFFSSGRRASRQASLYERRPKFRGHPNGCGEGRIVVVIRGLLHHE